MIALIDADIVVHRVGFTTEADSEGIARVRTDEMLETILAETQATEYECWLSDTRENNFRYKIYPAYKANRVAPRPKHYDVIKEHMITQWGARFAHEMEADDALGIAQDKEFTPFGHAPIKAEGSVSVDEETFHSTIICSIDKDLLQIPGLHYNFVTKILRTVFPWEGLQWFYQQLLIGDTSDNVLGCEGIGIKKAGQAILPICPEEGEGALLRKVFETYQAQSKKQKDKSKQKSLEEIVSHIRLAGNLLKIRQQEDEPLWDSQSCKLMEELQLSSTPPKAVENTPSTELTSPVATKAAGSPLLGKPMVLSSETADIQLST